MMLNAITKDEQPACRCFSMSELSSATDKFDEKWCIGHRGFGKVYKGKVCNGPTNFLYAIKRLHFDSHQGATEFWVEVKMLSRLRHCNIVPLFGYCNEGNEMALVYEYMPNGTLYDHLHKKGTNLTWSQRLKICIGAARGLDYLHTGTGTRQGVIHRDVKSSNILLDQNYDAKIADFGSAKIGPTNQACTYVSTTVKGTFGYMDPNYFYTGRLTRKSDVYSFGVVLVEVLSGRPAVDESLEEGLAIWAQDLIERGRLTQIISSSFRDHISKSSLKEFSSIAARCLLSLPNQRPTMTVVIGSLVRALSFQETKGSSTQGSGINIMQVWSFINSLKGHFEHGSPGWGDILALTSVNDDVDLGTGLRRFTLRDLARATNNFYNDQKLCDGEFRCVYKGCLPAGERNIMVVAEKISQGFKLRKQECMTVMKIICRLRHRNLVKIIGWCHDKTQLLLVYEFMPNGSLDHYLFYKYSFLLWDMRYRIITGLASALLYLHEQCTLHGNIKASNIMLDSNFIAKLGHFGLAGLMDNERDLKTTGLAGTLGYMALSMQ
ncbi:putative serine/threonine-protein kinase PBL7 [Bidens hawaiensis]|uniref:putative serine/threonine-protein kinase PBL7 n=1 Tax=Bidens hawaiensis TaxID=980011 RepID=UPI00404B84A2